MTFPFSRSSHHEVPAETRGKALAFIIELIQVLAVSAAIVIPLRYFLVQPFYVKGASMEPNFYDHEYLFIDKISYRYHEPSRGDIVVFRYPRDQSQFFIKRAIGLPGETIEIANGKIKIYNKEHENGLLVDETGYLDQDYTASTKTVTLKSDEYYLLGDNRASSLDSRVFGQVKRALLVGRVWVRAYPFDRWKHFTIMDYPQL